MTRYPVSALLHVVRAVTRPGLVKYPGASLLTAVWWVGEVEVRRGGGQRL